MRIFIVTGSQGEYSDRIDWNICAFHTEAEAEACVNKLNSLQEYNEKFYETYRAQKEEINLSHPIPNGPVAPVPSDEFRMLQQAVAYGKGSPEQKEAFRKVQAEHIQNLGCHKERLMEWMRVKESILDLQDQKAQEWFDLNYSPPGELIDVQQYSNFSSKASYYRAFDVRYSYEEHELHDS